MQPQRSPTIYKQSENTQQKNSPKQLLQFLQSHYASFLEGQQEEIKKEKQTKICKCRP